MRQLEQSIVHEMLFQCLVFVQDVWMDAKGAAKAGYHRFAVGKFFIPFRLVE
jgi:hypothetical protein